MAITASSPITDRIERIIREEANNNGGLVDLHRLYHRDNFFRVYNVARDVVENVTRMMGFKQVSPHEWKDTRAHATIQLSPMSYYSAAFGGGISSIMPQPGAPLKVKTIRSPKKTRPRFEINDEVEFLVDVDGKPAGTIGIIIDINAGMENLVVELERGMTWNVQFDKVKNLTHDKSKRGKVTIDSVILSPEKKEEIRSAISQENHNELIFDTWGFSEVFEKGTAISLLFYGTPGTGKTLMAQAIADEMGYDLKMYSTADIESSEPGGAERMIRTIFAKITGKKKKVILFDECDSLLMDRNEVGPVLGAQVNALLSEIERYGGIVIFTTNRLGKLDAALERRITAKIEFPFPDQKQRAQIWERMIPKKAPVQGIDYKKLAKYAVAGGNIKNAVLNAARSAAYKKHTHITMDHFIEAVKREEASLKAFADSYDKHPHHNMAAGPTREHGKVSVDMNKEINIKKELSIDKLFARGEARNE